MDTTRLQSPAEKNLLVIEATKREILRGLAIFLLVAETFLFLRVILALVGANPSSLFAGFVYIISGIILIPFFGIFPQFQDTMTSGQIKFDAGAVIAMFCYLLIILLIMGVVAIISNMRKTKRQVNETVKKDTVINTTRVDEAVH